MATHEVDQKLLGRLAKRCAATYPEVSGAMFQILGISVMLGPRLLEARRSRRGSTDGDTQSLILLHQILWLSRTGHEILETYVAPAFRRRRKPDILLEIMVAKLKGSFEHIFCLFRNDPPISRFLKNLTPPKQPPLRQGATPLGVISGNGRQSSSRNQRSQDPSLSKDNRSPNPQTGSSGRRSNLREPVPSTLSETSYITNPYSTISPPPGLPPLAPLPISPNFILSSKDYRKTTAESFEYAAKLGKEHLYASHPMVLSIALEQCAFLWDCMHQHEESRRLARRTIRELRRDSTPMDDEEFADASVLVSTLGRMMRRKSSEETPRFGAGTPTMLQATVQEELPQQTFPSAPSMSPPQVMRDDVPIAARTPPRVVRDDVPIAARTPPRVMRDDVPITARTPPRALIASGQTPSPRQRPTPDKPLPALPNEIDPPRSQQSPGLSRDNPVSRSIQKTPPQFLIPRRPMEVSGGIVEQRSNPSPARGPPVVLAREYVGSPSRSLPPSPETTRTSTKRPSSPGQSPTRKHRTRSKNGSGGASSGSGGAGGGAGGVGSYRASKKR